MKRPEIIKSLAAEESNLLEQARALRAIILQLGGGPAGKERQIKAVKGKKPRNLSAAGRAAISRAAKKRWAKHRSAQKKSAAK